MSDTPRTDALRADALDSQDIRAWALLATTLERRLSEKEVYAVALRDVLLRAKVHLGEHDKDYHHETPKWLYDQIDAALAKNPNPSGHISAEASAPKGARAVQPELDTEASGPVGLGPDTYIAPVPAGFTHALDCAYKRSVRNHCTCGYVDKERG